MPRAIHNIWPFDSFTKTIYHRSGITTSTSSRSRYKGHIIHKRGDGTFDIPSIDPSSIFDTLKDAKRFVDYQMKHGYSNPSMKRVIVNIKNPADWFQRCVEGVESKGGAYDPQAVCAGVMRRKKGRGNPTTYLVQYSILNKNYSVGFSTLKAAEKAVEKLAQHGRKATIVIQGKKSRNPIAAGLLDISPYYTAQLVDSASRGIRKKISHHRRNPKSEPGPYTGETIYLERLRLDRQGYTRSGEYFGVGAPVFRYELYNAQEYGELRAYNRSDARARLKQKYPGAKIK